MPFKSEEQAWLTRRRDLLRRAIAEMESHQEFPHLTLELTPNVPELLVWARDELSRIDVRLAQLTAPN